MENASPRYQNARVRAQALRALRRGEIPLDLDALAGGLEVPIVERSLPEAVRGTIGDIGGRRAIILNRDHRFQSAGARRWTIAEELGHVLLEHHLVDSTAPGTPRIGLREYQRDLYEKEARAFAAELLMPLVEVRRRWLDAMGGLPSGITGDGEERIRQMAREFGVTPTAMRIRLRQLRLL